jgi:hypothetical protein
MVGVNKESVLAQIGKATEALELFVTLPQDATREALQHSLATVAEGVQAMQPVLNVALTFEDAETKQMLLRYRECLQKLQPALEAARNKLLEHQRRFQLHLVRMQKRSAWADSVKASIGDAESSMVEVEV